ncbi:MAG TPA: Asp-tRNA(Asn)/Glu-tRNA(Gln) amidotransferase subunit GatA [Candidatus Wirthbacteria bacterium]|nr:Asp-tRNA(Asn)/Glu-tRNA(Gln) amidotransferase subunit GatA [Candidatus Wirthbacteria bacterium]
MNYLNQLTIKQALSGLEQKEFTCQELVQDCLQAIDKHDPKLKAYLTVEPEQALAAAQKADQNRASGQAGFLEGIPLAIKDNFSVQGMRTTASSKMLDDYVPPFNATVIARLRAAGTIVLGKTNLDAFAHGSSTETSDYFTTLNPWDTSRLPGGSSGGSAAAVSADLCLGAMGSETAGSVRGPASWCGCTGFKPTYGRVSRYGVVAMASSTDSPGPLTKTIEDAALILQIIAGQDEHDSTSSPLAVGDYLAACAKEIKGVKIGLPKQYFLPEISDDIKQAVMDAVREFEKMGASVQEVDCLDPKYSIAVYTILQRAEVASNLSRLDGNRYGNNRSFMGDEAVNRIMSGTYVLAAEFQDQYYRKGKKVRQMIIDNFASIFEQVDVLMSPTFPMLAPRVGASQETAIFGELMDVLVEPSSLAGLPGLGIPCGFAQPKDGDKKLPIGMQIIGSHFSEELLFSLGHAYQQATSWHLEKPMLS